ncbi:hypothetical protein BBK36DRAFT_1171449 [Trichoderma citrinoviride]|uniref:RING-type E3 ubiquitin transferase n=1 Tax=Trichoderma citrinoviride TaxID=58853 RepID=A0A2T4B3W2_9HYPO|nr:hypothetical protein BBK36DRAFT_1171449 [Trichoderma citrinoviride]PTB64005.1 hypothetical protein BBK36DRAFT_1171449 [Trichoderma citrinoviride]
MDFGRHEHRHLDATAGREVVYCHACSHEWYRDEQGLLCPSCDSDITEIVSPDNDPRDFGGSETSSTEPPSYPIGAFDNDDDHHQTRGRGQHHDMDSDPDEADIEEHLGPHGFHFRRSIRVRPGDEHHDPAVDPVIERFLGMIQDFAPTQRPADGFRPRADEPRPAHAHPHIHRATFVNGSGSASVTIFSGPSSGFFGPGSPGHDHHGDLFQTFFSNVLRDVSPPVGGREAGGATPGFARGLQEILNLFNPAHAISGDAVYSQEALDQIITNLMEAHPTSNAAPPASSEALANLDRRPVVDSMLEGDSKTECTICIDDMKVGDEAAFLPCKHWFHEECVVLWLKEHNTCPVCRASIEKAGGDNSNRTNDQANARATAATSAGPSSDAYPPPQTGEPFTGSAFTRSFPLPIPAARPQYSRPPSQSQSRLNEAMRSISSLQQERQQQQDREQERHRIWGIPLDRGGERQQERERERDRLWGVASSTGYDTSRMQRRASRTSASPTSPRMSSFADYRVRQRQGSPTQSSRRDGGNNNANGNGNGNGGSGSGSGSGQQTSSSGPFSWLRDRFSGGGSRDDSNRDER